MFILSHSIELPSFFYLRYYTETDYLCSKK
nr:MAG TPA: hypothetical protein [Caudoviricetes sp.]